MKLIRRWWLILPVFLLILASRTVMAEWVPIYDPIVITQKAPLQMADGFIKVTVAVSNTSTETNIEGKVRLIFTKSVAGFPAPANALAAGEGGNNPTPYFEIGTRQADFFEAGEVSFVSMLFSMEAIDTFFAANLLPSENILGTIQTYYTLHAEINDQSILTEIFRKKISKTPETYSGEALIQPMEVYVKAKNTKGQNYIRDSVGELVVCCAEGEVSDACADCTATPDSEFAMIKPLIVTYIGENDDVPFNNVPMYDPNGDGVADEGLRFARDVYVAISLDDGLTWKESNLSRTSTKSSFSVATGAGDLAYPGDSESQGLIVGGHYALVTWVDKYCRSGNPWDMPDADDIYHVTGSQNSVDYLDVKGDEDPRPDLGVRPFSCMWAARGVLELDQNSPNYGTIAWYKPEQLTSGRRDAIHNFGAAIEPLYDSNGNAMPGTGGFAIAWQEDPIGLKTGKGRGPGAGMTGASVNHKTDIWYSYIDWVDFAAVDTAFVPSDGGDTALPTGDSDGNAEYFCPTCSYVYDSEVGDPANGIAPGTKFSDLPAAWVCPLDGTPKSEFVKDARPHALHHLSAPVPLTNNAVCRDRIPEPVYGHRHDPAVTDCDYYYEGGTTNEPLLWDELPNDWVCPKCGRPKTTFLATAELIKYRNEGAPYCDQFAANPRVDQDGNYAIPGSDAARVAFYTQNGQWKDAAGTTLSTDPSGAIIQEDGKAMINGTRVYWSGHPLDGNTGASRPNLALTRFNTETLAVVAYEETKGVGTGSDKVAAAMEQKAPYPLVKMNGVWEAGATNSDCRSCHYQNVVPRDRVIPVDNEDVCVKGKGGVWKAGQIEAYYPYTGYPYITEDPVAVLPSGVSTINPISGTPHAVPCVKYEGGRKIYPRDWERKDSTAYYDLPDHMPGWHQAALDCTHCHLPYNTKDSDKDGVIDRVDLCLETPADESADTLQTSPTYGCSLSQDPNDLDNNKGEVDRYRHGKNIYYHNFNFALPSAVAHGDQVNLPNKYGWSEQGDKYENARRVRVVVNEDYDPASGADVTLGLLYKEGKDGQGAPADALLRLFRNGFSAGNMDAEPLNISSSTPAWFKNPLYVGTEDGTGDNSAGDGSGDLIGNHKTPNVENFYWTDANLHDGSGFWQEDGSGDKLWQEDGFTPKLLGGNPFENVFSTRLAIRGNTIVTGFAHCANWSAGKKAKDHYDFYVRVSKDSGRTWTLPVNVSRLKNHEESVSDCRVILTPETIDQPYPIEQGSPADISMNGAAEVYEAGDFNNPNVLFVAVGTKENLPQLYPNEDEEDEIEIFRDVFYSKAIIQGTVGGEYGDLAMLFETYSKENPLWVEGSAPYLDRNGWPTNDAKDPYGIPNQPNPAYPKYVEEFNWMAKGDANQGDVQVGSNPYGTKLYTVWEQELPISDVDGQKHFQGRDVWFRRVSYLEPGAASNGDVDGDGDTDWDDGTLLHDSIGMTAYDPDFPWAGDYVSDFRITGVDYSRWKVQFAEGMQKKQRKQWISK